MPGPVASSAAESSEAVFDFAAAPRDVLRRRLEWLRSRHGLRWRLWDFLVGWSAFCAGFLVSPWTERLPALYYLLLVGGVHGFILAVMSRLCGVPNPEDRAGTYELIAHAFIAVALTYLLFSTVVWLDLVWHHARYISLL